MTTEQNFNDEISNSSLPEEAFEDAYIEAIEVCEELQAAGIDTSSHELRH